MRRSLADVDTLATRNYFCRMTAIAKELDAKLKLWRSSTAEKVEALVSHIIALADRETPPAKPPRKPASRNGDAFLADKKVFNDTDVEEVAAEMNDEARGGAVAKRRRKTDTSAANDALSSPPAKNEVVQLHPNANSTGDPLKLMSSLGSDALGEQLLQIEQGMRRLDATMLRIERSNLVSTALFRRLLDWVRTREAGRDDAA